MFTRFKRWIFNRTTIYMKTVKNEYNWMLKHIDKKSKEIRTAAKLQDARRAGVNYVENMGKKPGGEDRGE